MAKKSDKKTNTVEETTMTETKPSVETIKTAILSDNQALQLRVQLLEHEIQGLKTIVHQILGMVPQGQSKASSDKQKPGKAKLTKDEKAALKIELLAGMPYEADEIKNLGVHQMRMLCGALKLPSFGIDPQEMIKAILAEQTKRAKKK